MFAPDMLQSNHCISSILSTNAESPFYICRLLEALVHPVILTTDPLYFVAQSTFNKSNNISNYIKSNNIFSPALRLLSCLRDSYFPFNLVDLENDHEKEMEEISREVITVN